MALGRLDNTGGLSFVTNSTVNTIIDDNELTGKTDDCKAKSSALPSYLDYIGGHMRVV